MSESFVAVFVNSALSKGQALSLLSLFFLFLARFLPIVALSPFFGSRVMPQTVKVTFAITMFVIFMPKMVLVTTSAITFNEIFVLLAVKEIAIGFIMGLIISMPFMIVQNSGLIIDHQRGGASLMVNDPTIQNQSSPLGTMFNLVMIYLFYMIDGPFIFIDAILSSYDVLPPDQFISSHFFDKNLPFWQSKVKLLNDVMSISIRLASPALIMILMTDFFLGIANRLAPQVQITFLGMPLKSLLALLVVALGWNLMAKEFTRQGYYWLNQVIELLKVLKGANS